MKITSRRVLNDGQWVILKEAAFIDEQGAQRSWVYVERRGGRQAVVVVPTTEHGALLLIRQLRIPFGREVIEFPAGLMDPGESPEETAVRELREETGHTGTIVRVGPPVSSSAGITTETVTLVHMRVGESPDSAPELEASERIEAFLLPRRDFSSLLARAAREELLLDAKLYMYLAEAAATDRE